MIGQVVAVSLAALLAGVVVVLVVGLAWQEFQEWRAECRKDGIRVGDVLNALHADAPHPVQMQAVSKSAGLPAGLLPPHVVRAAHREAEDERKRWWREHEARVRAAEPVFDFEAYSTLKAELEWHRQLFWHCMATKESVAADEYRSQVLNLEQIADRIGNIERALELMNEARGTDPDLIENPYETEGDE